MISINQETRVSEEDTVMLKIPSGHRGWKVKASLVLEPETPAETDAKGYPIGFWESIAGKWEGELERAPELPLEERMPLE